MPSFPGLLRNLRYVNSNVAERTVETKQAGQPQSVGRVDRERRAGSDALAKVYSAPHVEKLLLSDERRIGCRRSEETDDRRRLCRRILRQAVLVEFRSGAGRRRRHLREDDMLMHVSIKV